VKSRQSTRANLKSADDYLTKTCLPLCWRQIPYSLFFVSYLSVAVPSLQAGFTQLSRSVCFTFYLDAKSNKKIKAALRRMPAAFL
jgi:hypothetical protein